MENEIFFSNLGLRIWLWCLLKANWKDGSFPIGNKIVYVARGEFITGSLKATSELRVSRTTFWRWIERLEVGHYIRTSKTRKYTIITIVNWNTYQQENDEGGTKSRHIQERIHKEYSIEDFINALDNNKSND